VREVYLKPWEKSVKFGELIRIGNAFFEILGNGALGVIFRKKGGIGLKKGFCKTGVVAT